MVKKFHRIRELKAKYGLANTDLAEVAGCSENSIVNKLNGIRPFSIVEAASLIYYFSNLEKDEEEKKRITFQELFFNDVFTNENTQKGA